MMAVSTDTTDPAAIYQALLVERYTDTSWREYLRARSRADDGRSPATRRQR